MALFFFDVRDRGGDVSHDTEGQEFDDLEAARCEAISVSRELLGERLLHGGPIDGRRIEIVSEAGDLLAVVSADDVLFHDGQYQSYGDDVTKSAPVASPTGMKPPAE
jgi:hypothetical protein